MAKARGPSGGSLFSSSAEPAKPRRLKTLSGSTAPSLSGKQPIRPATDGSRLGHTTRYSHLSINNPPRRSRIRDFRGEDLLHAAYRLWCIGFGALDTSAFRRNCVSPVGCAQRSCARGGGERVRTDDLLLAKQALSQLSYTPLSVIRDRGSVIRTAAARLQPCRLANGVAAIGSDY